MFRFGAYTSEFYDHEQIALNDGRLEGRLGGPIHQLLTKLFGKNITYVEVDEFGTISANGSASGVLGLFQQNKIDGFFIPHPYKAYPVDLVTITSPVSHTSIKLISVFEFNLQFGDISDLTKYASIRIWYLHWACILSALLFLLSFAFLLHRSDLIKDRSFSILQMTLNYSYQINGHDRLSMCICMLALMWGLFHFNTILMYQINVELFSTKTASLKQTLQEYAEGDFWPCWLEGESERNLFENKSMHSMWGKLWNNHDKLGRPRCFLKKSFDSLMKVSANHKDTFVILKDYFLNAIIESMCKSFAVNIWKPNIFISEEVEGYYFNTKSKALIDKAKFYNRLNTIESAITVKTGCGMRENTFGRFDGEHCVYESLSQVRKIINSRRVLQILYQNCTTLWICWSVCICLSLVAFVIGHIWKRKKSALVARLHNWKHRKAEHNLSVNENQSKYPMVFIYYK